MTQKRVCMKCDSLVEVATIAPSGITTFQCPRCGVIPFRDTRPVGKRFGARKGFHIKTWAKNRKRNVLAKASRRRNR